LVERLSRHLGFVHGSHMRCGAVLWGQGGISVLAVSRRPTRLGIAQNRGGHFGRFVAVATGCLRTQGTSSTAPMISARRSGGMSANDDHA